MSNVQLFRKEIDNLKGRRDQVRDSIKMLSDKAIQLKKDIINSEEAQIRIQLVAKETQNQLKFYIETPVEKAQAGVFDDPYEFELRFEERRSQTEADLVFKKDGVEYRDLVFSGGGGETDVAAYGLQIAALALRKDLRRFLMLDEPLKHLKSSDKTLEKRGALMIGETARGLKMQILMVSHIPEQQKGADRIYKFVLRDKVTYIE